MTASARDRSSGNIFHFLLQYVRRCGCALAAACALLPVMEKVERVTPPFSSRSQTGDSESHADCLTHLKRSFKRKVVRSENDRRDCLLARVQRGDLLLKFFLHASVPFATGKHGEKNCRSYEKVLHVGRERRNETALRRRGFCNGLFATSNRQREHVYACNHVSVTIQPTGLGLVTLWVSTTVFAS